MNLYLARLQFMMDSQVNDEAKGAGKSKHKWVENEDDKLVECMLDILNTTGTLYRADNGFKPGFYLAIEKALAEKLPAAGIKAKPHIESRLKTLKTEWAVVYDMLHGKDSSGFGWDAENHVLEASKDVWIPYLKVSHFLRFEAFNF